MPKVSIVLPNLNNRKYLDERLKSIWYQTLEDWELIVVDSYSSDGAWEFFQECSKKDERIKIYQSGELGIYNNLNKCIEYAKGEYIYIATSDDTMESTLLEKMVSALDIYRECDIAHCKLKIIDEHGEPTNISWDNFYIIRYFGENINRLHIRKAPHDGLLHFMGITAYTSLTQLLIRRSLFDKIGLFSNEYGSFGDYEWDLRATLVSNTVHVPEYLAYWRRHDQQATDSLRLSKSKASGLFIKMSRDAVNRAKKINPSFKYHFNDLNILLKLDQLCNLKKYPTFRFHSIIPLIFFILTKKHYALSLLKILQSKHGISEDYRLKFIKKIVAENIPTGVRFLD